METELATAERRADAVEAAAALAESKRLTSEAVLEARQVEARFEGGAQVGVLAQQSRTGIIVT